MCKFQIDKVGNTAFCDSWVPFPQFLQLETLILHTLDKGFLHQLLKLYLHTTLGFLVWKIVKISVANYLDYDFYHCKSKIKMLTLWLQQGNFCKKDFLAIYCMSLSLEENYILCIYNIFYAIFCRLKLKKNQIHKLHYFSMNEEWLPKNCCLIRIHSVFSLGVPTTSWIMRLDFQKLSFSTLMMKSILVF